MQLKIKGVTKIEYFTHGKRGELYTGMRKGMKVVIKTKRPESEAIGRIENEGRWLEILNTYGIGPRLMMKDPGYIVYQYVEGQFFPDFLQSASKKESLNTIRSVFNQLRTLDKLRVDKEEMHHPIKHILVGKETVLIDFERCHMSEEPKNVTQFCQYMMSLEGVLKEKGIDVSVDCLIGLARKYKHEQTDENFYAILDMFR